MYIPASLASGATSVTCTVPLSGDLLAACEVVYEGTTYAPGVTIPVAQGKTVKLNTTVTVYAEISVQLGGKQYYWFVDLPKSLRYVNDLAYQRITGTVYGKLTHYPSGTQVPYTDTGTFTAGDTVASIDFIKKEIWFFNAAGNVKKVTVPVTPVAVVFAPRWSLTDGVETVAYIITVSSVIKLTATFSIDTTSAVTAGVVAASGDVDGNIVLVYNASLVRFNPVTAAVVSTIANENLSGLHAIYVTHDNAYITCGTGGIKRTALLNAIYVTSVMVPWEGMYLSIDGNDTDLYFADGMNRCVVKVSQADSQYSFTYFDDVPRSVVVKDTQVYVGFFDTTNTFTYALDMTGKVVSTTTKTYGATYLADYVVTDLYSNANTVTLVESAVDPVLIQPADSDIDTAMHYDWTVTWPRPEYIKLATSPGAVVKKNGTAFTEGYLRYGDVISIDLPATSEYYYDRFVTFMGRRSTQVMLRTEPRLFPNPVSLPQILDAVPNHEYFSDDYVVAGITEGFTAAVTSDPTESEVSFSVNGGDYGYSGTIKNGDVISVVSMLKNLRPKRNTHETRAAGEVVFSITILPMVLNGVEIRREKTDLRKRYDGTIGLSQHPQELPAFGTLIGLQGTLVETGGLYPKKIGAHSMLPGLTRPTALRMTQGALFKSQEGNPTPKVMQQGSLHNPGLGNPQPVMLPNPVQVLETEADAVKLLQGSLYSVDFELLAIKQGSPLLAYTPEPFAVYQYGGYWTYIPELEAFRSVQSHSFNYEMEPYKESLASAQEFDGQIWGKSQPQRIRYVSVIWRYGNKIHRVEIDNQFDSRTAQHKEYIDSVYDSRTDKHVEYIDTAFERRTLLNRHYVDGVFEGRQLYHREVIGAPDWERRWSTSSPKISAAYQHRPTATALGVDTIGELNHHNARIKFSMSVARRTGSSVEVAKATPMFAVASQDFELPPEASGFGDLAQAQAYATDVGAQRTEFFEVEGKWIFVAKPLAENAMCGIIVKPPEQRKRYGYVGGG